MFETSVLRKIRYLMILRKSCPTVDTPCKNTSETEKYTPKVSIYSKIFLFGVNFTLVYEFWD